MKQLTMKKSLTDLKKLGVIASVAVLMTACASTPKAPEGAAEVRSKLTRLQSDPQLATRAPVAIKDAEQAVTEAEKPNKDKAFAAHRVWIADRKVDTAAAQAEAFFLEDQRKTLSEQTANARLESRTLEADSAHNEALSAKQQADDLQRQIAELNAKATERGLVVTLGDLLFETGSANLKSNALTQLSKLSAFLSKYPNRSVVIEGHTDSVGSASYNYSLSQRRADSVKTFLLNQGVAGGRIVATGKGEDVPVADNSTSNGRQLNRRVEVIINNPDTTQ